MFSTVCSKRPSGLDQMYSKYAILVNGLTSKSDYKHIFKELKKSLERKLPDYESFETSLRKMKYSKGHTKQGRVISYLFERLENHMSGTNEILLNDSSLEHIYPESEGKSIYPDFFDSLGNLMPLSRELNEEAGNNPVQDKIDIYKRSRYKLVEDFLAKFNIDWGSEEIESRQISLTKTSWDMLMKPFA